MTIAEAIADRSLSRVTVEIISWLERREYTIGLALFLTAWYLFQLFIVDMIGVEAAQKWFYFTPDLGTGWIAAPFSHNVQDIDHLLGNLTSLFLAGSLIEPHLKTRQYITVILISMAFSIIIPVIGLILLVDEEWLVAGASGGVYGLWVFASIYRFDVVQKWRVWISVDEWEDLRYWFECVIVLFGFTLPVVVPFVDLYSGGSANSISHISGMALGGVLGLKLKNG
ncbi:rhomboid family intramembrane serine protease [Halorubrum ezzemoulense]|nr:rhomboid family intramembrane serine protease [Halorubrum ezzemoulense]